MEKSVLITLIKIIRLIIGVRNTQMPADSDIYICNIGRRVLKGKALKIDDVTSGMTFLLSNLNQINKKLNNVIKLDVPGRIHNPE